MHFARAGLPHHADNLAAGGAAHDRIVHQHDALALQQVAHRVELELDSEIANGLRRLDKRAPHVMVADQRLAERQAALIGIADGGGHAGIRHGDYEIGIGGTLARQQAAQILARFFHRAAEHHGIGACEIDVFEDTLRARLLRSVALARDAFGPDDHHLAGIDFVQVDRADQVEGAGLGGEDVALAAAGDFHFAHRQRAEAVRIARHDDAVLGEEHQGERAFQLQQRIAQGAGQRALRGVGHQVEHDFGIAGRLEDGAAAAQVGAQLVGIGDVAVVRDGHFALVADHGKRLGVEQDGIAGGGIARVPDGQIAGQLGQHVAGEDVGHMPHGLVGVDLVAVRGADAGALLPAVLQGVESEVRQLGCLGVAVDGDHTAFLVEFIEHALRVPPRKRP